MTAPLTIQRRSLDRVYGRLIGVRVMHDLMLGRLPPGCTRRPPAEQLRLSRDMTIDAIAEVEAMMLDVEREMVA